MKKAPTKPNHHPTRRKFCETLGKALLALTATQVTACLPGIFHKKTEKHGISHSVDPHKIDLLQARLEKTAEEILKYALLPQIPLDFDTQKIKELLAERFNIPAEHLTSTIQSGSSIYQVTYSYGSRDLLYITEHNDNSILIALHDYTGEEVEQIGYLANHQVESHEITLRNKDEKLGYNRRWRLMHRTDLRILESIFTPETIYTITRDAITNDITHIKVRDLKTFDSAHYYRDEAALEEFLTKIP